MKSKYGDRETVGTIYQEAQKNVSDLKGAVVGDVNAEFLGGLVDDINDAIKTNNFNGRPFYINVVEERDLQMKNALKRRLFLSIYRPYPEDNTLVFYVEPKTNKVCYCWDLPHHSEMPNVLCNSEQYDNVYIQRINEWLGYNLVNFGFEKTIDGEHWIPNPNYIDREFNHDKPKISLVSI